MKPSSAKGKGRRLQQWAAEKIAKLVGEPHGKDQPVESRPMGQSGPDIRMESSVRERFPFSVECKYQENWSVHEWIKQAKQNQVEGTEWLLICKRNRQEPVVIMDAEAFFRMILASNTKSLTNKTYN